MVGAQVVKVTRREQGESQVGQVLYSYPSASTRETERAASVFFSIPVLPCRPAPLQQLPTELLQRLRQHQLQQRAWGRRRLQRLPKQRKRRRGRVWGSPKLLSSFPFCLWLWLCICSVWAAASGCRQSGVYCLNTLSQSLSLSLS